MPVEEQTLKPGPTLKPGSPSPCGCRVSPDMGGEKLRLWFCRTHAAAFDMLDALQVSLKALETVVKLIPTALSEDHPLRHAQLTVQTTIQKAMDSYDYKPSG